MKWDGAVSSNVDTLFGDAAEKLVHGKAKSGKTRHATGYWHTPCGILAWHMVRDEEGDVADSTGGSEPHLDCVDSHVGPGSVAGIRGLGLFAGIQPDH